MGYPRWGLLSASLLLASCTGDNTIIASTVAELKQAIDTANMTGVQTVISLASGSHALDLSTPHSEPLGEELCAGATGLVVKSGSHVTIHGNGFTLSRSGGPEFRIFYVDPNASLTLNDLTVTGGLLSTSSGSRGGGICNAGKLALVRSAVRDNGAHLGGGIANVAPEGTGSAGDGTTTLTTSRVEENEAFTHGGGIYNLRRFSELMPKLSLTDSSVRTNRAFDAGGVFNEGGELHLDRSTLSENKASKNGGAIVNLYGTAQLTNVTLSGNTAAGDVGAMSNVTGASATLTHVTVTRNAAGKKHGGLKNKGKQLQLVNTIVAQNTDDGTAPDCFGAPASGGHNLIGDATGCGFTPLGTDIVGVVDPRLGPLQDNGGPTHTHALLDADAPSPASPAVDAAGDCNPPTATDARGQPRPADGDGDGMAYCDIGAYEKQPKNDRCHERDRDERRDEDWRRDEDERIEEDRCDDEDPRSDEGEKRRARH
ncbi:MAG: hypothetical protein MJD61_16900 [Proteobacteria bacterium]|nr:hypothetical protein [Pseudomonadota bacterium]